MQMFVVLWLLLSGVCLGVTPLTDDAAGVPEAVTALAKEAGVDIKGCDLTKVQKNYAFVSKDSSYQKAHKVYRLLAAMTLVGDDNLLYLTDLIWATGLEKNNSILHVIGYTWGDNATNDAESKIYQARFEVERYRPADSLKIFATDAVWQTFVSHHSKVTSSQKWWESYAQTLAGTHFDFWKDELWGLIANPTGVWQQGMLARLSFAGKVERCMWGTPSVKVSPLHSRPFWGYVPQIMALDSLEDLQLLNQGFLWCLK